MSVTLDFNDVTSSLKIYRDSFGYIWGGGGGSLVSTKQFYLLKSDWFYLSVMRNTNECSGNFRNKRKPRKKAVITSYSPKFISFLHR